MRYKEFNRYWIQGLIYRLILGSEFDRHNESKFKWFNFSNIFPKRDFKIDEEKKLIISSPNEDFINYLYEKLNEIEGVTFSNKYSASITGLKMFKIKNLNEKWITDTPIILDIGKIAGAKHLYWTPKLKDKELASFKYFLKRLTENSLKKIAVYYELNYNDLLEKYPLVFQTYKFVDSKKIVINKGIVNVKMAGTLWELVPDTLPIKFLSLLFETGLGEKNSLGFGFVKLKNRIELKDS